MPEQAKPAGVNASDLIGRARLSAVWVDLGGPELRRGRGRAWWRAGGGYNVALDDVKGAWIDHARDNSGGGILDLITIVQGCSRAEALHWLADHLGESLPMATPERRREWRRQREERRAARWWGIAARALAEELLDGLHMADPNRLPITALLSTVRTVGLLDAYRGWRAANPALAAALVAAGRVSECRRQVALAAYVAELGVSDAAG